MIRVYADMVGDLFHYGHVRFLEQARKQGDMLVVGVHSDKTVAGYKRAPVMTMAERIQVIAACQFVDEVIPDAPLEVTREFVEEHELDLVVHGDDLDEDSLETMYRDPRAMGILTLVPYANGVSSTAIMERVRRRSFAVVK